MAYVLDGFANATEVLCGKAIGLKNRVMLRQALKLNSYWAFAVAVCFSSLYYLFGSQIISLLTSIDEVIFTAEQYLPWLIVMPIIGVWAYLLDGLFIGATRSKEMRNTMLFSTFICYLPCWYLTQEMGNTGLWLSLLVMLAARGISQSFYLPRIMAIKQ
jgi:MATE family multidrug resistance protein